MNITKIKHSKTIEWELVDPSERVDCGYEVGDLVTIKYGYVIGEIDNQPIYSDTEYIGKVGVIRKVLDGMVAIVDILPNFKYHNKDGMSGEYSFYYNQLELKRKAINPKVGDKFELFSDSSDYLLHSNKDDLIINSISKEDEKVVIKFHIKYSTTQFTTKFNIHSIESLNP